jgi:predicted SnoaL-like aldol condensation-catalyzing enzyme
VSASSREATALEFLRCLRAGDVSAATGLVTRTARHHNPYFPAGMPALIHAAAGAAKANPDRQFDVQRVVADRDHVVVHSHVRHRPGEPGVAVVHIFRFEGDRIAELWDLGQPVATDGVNDDGMF